MSEERIQEYQREVVAVAVRQARGVKPIIAIEPTGDPYGRGFEAIESQDGGASWFYRGDVGARSRDYWRWYCRRNGYTLRYGWY